MPRPIYSDEVQEIMGAYSRMGSSDGVFQRIFQHIYHTTWSSLFF